MRLRAAAVAGVLALGLLNGAPAGARQAPMTILIAAPVASNALTMMSPAAWIAIVTRYANTEHSIFTTLPHPTVDDCLAAKALYLLQAPFELNGDVTTSVSEGGVINGHSHVTLVNCLTGAVVFEKTIPLASSRPPDTGDLENPTNVSWDASAARELGRYPLPLATTARIKSIHDQVAIITTGDGVTVPSAYRVFAHADGTKAPPSILPVFNSNGTTVSAIVLTTQPPPHVGDYVEPMDLPAQR